MALVYTHAVPAVPIYCILLSLKCLLLIPVLMSLICCLFCLLIIQCGRLCGRQCNTAVILCVPQYGRLCENQCGRQLALFWYVGNLAHWVSSARFWDVCSYPFHTVNALPQCGKKHVPFSHSKTVCFTMWKHCGSIRDGYTHAVPAVPICILL